MQNAKREAVKRRLPYILDATVHIVVALVVLFSAALHEQVWFNAAAFGFSVLTIAALNCVSRLCLQQKISVYEWLYGVVCAASGLTMLLSPNVNAATFATIVLLWAAGTAVVKQMQLFTNASGEQNLRLQAGLLILLTVCVLISFADMVAVIGFFGAYAVIHGIFGLIAALDFKPDSAATE